MIDKILEKYEQMRPEELDAHIEKVLQTPLGKLLKAVNDETLEALKEIEDEESVS